MNNIAQYFNGANYLNASDSNCAHQLSLYSDNSIELELLSDNEQRMTSENERSDKTLRVDLPNVIFEHDIVELCEQIQQKGFNAWDGNSLQDFVNQFNWCNAYHDCETSELDEDDEQILRDLYAQGLTLPKVAEAFTAHCADMGNTVVNADSYASAVWEMLCNECNLTDEQLRL